jgi:hypothetical protein
MAPRKEKLVAEEKEVFIPAQILEQPKSGEIKPEEAKPPTMPSQISQFYLPFDISWGENESLIYRPALLGTTRLHFVSARAKIDQWKTMSLIASFSGEDLNIQWKEATLLEGEIPYLEIQPRSNTKFSSLPFVASIASSYETWRKSFSDYLYQHQTQDIWECRDFKEFSKIGESEGDFRGRLAHLLRERRDLEVEKLRKRYTPQLSRMQERLRKAQVRVEREKAQVGQQSVQTAVSVGATLIGAIFGRKTMSTGTIGRATTSMRGVGRISREKQDVERAKREVLFAQEKLAEMEEDFQAEIAKQGMEFQPEDLSLSEILIRPRKSDIIVERLALIWLPWKVNQDGLVEPAFRLH